MGVSMNGGTLKQMVYFMEYPILKWMMNRGTPILGNLHIYIYICVYIYITTYLTRALNPRGPIYLCAELQEV